MLKIELLPAAHGDALLIEYGDEKSPHRVLIDGGTPGSYARVDARLAQIGAQVDLDLLVVTHVDEDHIGGTLAQLQKNPGRLNPADVWFNGYRHLAPPDRLGAVQGETLSTAIQDLGWTWNGAWNGGSVVVPDSGDLPTVTLPGGAVITLLSPTWKKLGKLVATWEKECAKVGMTPGQSAAPSDVLGRRPPPSDIDVPALLSVKFKSESSAANGSSIAFLLEYDGKRVLLGADAHSDVLVSSLRRLSKDPLAIDAFKVNHHASQGNVSPALLDALQCSRYLISSDGSTYGHPDPEAIARIVATPGKKSLLFNYDSEYTRPWAQAALRRKYKYTTGFADPDAPLIVEL